MRCSSNSRERRDSCSILGRDICEMSLDFAVALDICKSDDLIALMGYDGGDARSGQKRIGDSGAAGHHAEA